MPEQEQNGWLNILSALGGNSGQATTGSFAKQTPAPTVGPLAQLGNGQTAAPTAEKGMFEKILNYPKENPELTAIILDYLGTSLAGRKEGNIASGLGTQLAKSGLNEKKLKDIESKKATGQENLIKTITDLIGGKTPGAGGFTPAGLTGMNSAQMKPNAQGGVNFKADFDIADELGVSPTTGAVPKEPNVSNFQKP